jgi:hypothetical protein
MSSCVCVGSRYRMRKYVALLLMALLPGGCADLGLAEVQGDGIIAGTITETPSGDRVNAGIFLHSPAREETTIVQTVDGNFLVRRLLPGNYVVEIDPPNGYELAPGTLNNVPVSIEGDETETVNFLLRRVTQ